MSILPQVAREELELWLSREDEPDSVEHLMTVAADNIQDALAEALTLAGKNITDGDTIHILAVRKTCVLQMQKGATAMDIQTVNESTGTVQGVTIQ